MYILCRISRLLLFSSLPPSVPAYSQCPSYGIILTVRRCQYVSHLPGEHIVVARNFRAHSINRTIALYVMKVLRHGMYIYSISMRSPRWQPRGLCFVLGFVLCPAEFTLRNDYDRRGTILRPWDLLGFRRCLSILTPGVSSVFQHMDNSLLDTYFWMAFMFIVYQYACSSWWQKRHERKRTIFSQITNR